MSSPGSSPASSPGGRTTFAKACIYFNHTGYFLEFEPKNRQGFPPEELFKLNCYAKKRAGILFVKVVDPDNVHDDDDDAFPPPSVLPLAKRSAAAAY